MEEEDLAVAVVVVVVAAAGKMIEISSIDVCFYGNFGRKNNDA